MLNRLRAGSWMMDKGVIKLEMRISYWVNSSIKFYMFETLHFDLLSDQFRVTFSYTFGFFDWKFKVT